MKKAKFSDFVQRKIARFDKQLEDGLWDCDLTDEELDKRMDESARRCDEIEREIMRDDPSAVMAREHESPYRFPKLKREDYNDD